MANWPYTTPINGQKYMGNWGYTLLLGVIIPFVTGLLSRIGCTPNVLVPMVYMFLLCLGILGNEKTHKYPRAIGLILRDFMTGYVGPGVHPWPSPELTHFFWTFPFLKKALNNLRSMVVVNP